VTLRTRPVTVDDPSGRRRSGDAPCASRQCCAATVTALRARTGRAG